MLCELGEKSSTGEDWIAIGHMVVRILLELIEAASTLSAFRHSPSWPPAAVQLLEKLESAPSQQRHPDRLLVLSTFLQSALKHGLLDMWWPHTPGSAWQNDSTVRYAILSCLVALREGAGEVWKSLPLILGLPYLPYPLYLHLSGMPPYRGRSQTFSWGVGQNNHGGSSSNESMGGWYQNGPFRLAYLQQFRQMARVFILFPSRAKAPEHGQEEEEENDHERKQLLRFRTFILPMVVSFLSIGFKALKWFGLSRNYHLWDCLMVHFQSPAIQKHDDWKDVAQFMIMLLEKEKEKDVLLAQLLFFLLRARKLASALSYLSVREIASSSTFYEDFAPIKDRQITDAIADALVQVETSIGQER